MRWQPTHHIMLAVGLLIGGGMPAHALGGTPATQSAADHDTLTLIHALNADAMQLAKLPEAMPSDPAARQREAERVIAIARDAMATIDKLPPDCHGQDMASMKVSWEPLLIVFGDQTAMAEAKRDARGTGPAAVLARVSILMADRINAKDDQKAADAAATGVVHEAQNNPTDDSAALALLQLSRDDGLSATTLATVAAALSKSPSRVGGAIRFAESKSATQPSR